MIRQSLPTKRDRSITSAEYRALPASPATSKYGAKPVVIDGHRFASTAEGNRYAALKLQERAGEISNLRLQVRHHLSAWGHPICVYVSDFDYVTKAGMPVTEDVKGVATPAFVLKSKLFRAQMGREVVIVRAK